MYLYDLDKIDFIKLRDSKINKVNINLNVMNFLNIRYDVFNDMLKDNIYNQLEKAALKENTLFKINFTTIEKLSEDDYDQIYNWIINIIFNYLFTGKKRDREYRLKVNMDYINCTYNLWKSMINNDTKINCFNIEAYFNKKYKVRLIER